MSDDSTATKSDSSEEDYQPRDSDFSTTVTTTSISSVDMPFSEDENDDNLNVVDAYADDSMAISPSQYSEESASFGIISPLPGATQYGHSSPPHTSTTPLLETIADEGVPSTSGGFADANPYRHPRRRFARPRRRHDSGLGLSDGSPSRNSQTEGTKGGVVGGGLRQTPPRKRQRVFCFFCEEPVLQFARHLMRNDNQELEVQRLACLRKGSLKRKRLLTLLRNKGNFIQSKATNFIRPVRKPVLKDQSTLPLPCKTCYGFFAKKQLWRHVRRCPGGNQANAEKVRHSHNLSQNMMLAHIEGNEFLKTNVFPHMRADDVTLAVKTDPLICAYGARFAKTHGQKHQVNFISRKMRELAKLLIALKRAEPEIKSLMDALTPNRYQLLVACAKEVAGFDEGHNRFSSPTYAMNIQTSLKDCCQIACNNLYQHANFPDKKSYEEAEFPFIRLMGTITSEWKYDVSHQAANDLQVGAMNKITIVPLATDLYRFKTFLVNLGNESLAALQYDDHDVQAYKNLMESVYCRVMLLCRKRCGELSRLTVEAYQKSGDRHSYEEFADAIRPSEMVLVRKFKRVVIQGKRKCTPVIFSDDVQRHVDMMLTVRDHFVPKTNPFLFGNVKTDNPISGYKVIKRHAANADLTHPEAITTRCLRKHLATVCQVLSMSDQDIEQLASFMGHTGQIHRQDYRLPDDIFQTAKVSKLLMMMEAGRAGHFKGKTLDEIEIDLECDIMNEIAPDQLDDEDAEELDGNTTNNASQVPAMAHSSLEIGRSTTATATSANKPLNKPKNFVRHLWSPEERRVTLEYFAEHITNKRAPKRAECERLITLHSDVLQRRSWQKVKIFVVNTYSKKSRPSE